MLETECRIYAFMLGYCERLAADIDDARLAEQPSPGVNPPAWLLGHLAVASDMGVGLFGAAEVTLRRVAQAVWTEIHPDLGPLGLSLEGRAPVRPPDELTNASPAWPEASSAEHLARPNPSGFFTKELPTTGDILAHLLTSHEGMHLGHLSNWRRQVGLPYLF